jgi:hypothetical protein
VHSLQRLQPWGFNSVDIFASDYILPVGTTGNGGQGSTVQVPFVMYFPTTIDARFFPSRVSIPEQVKDLCAGRNGNGYTGTCVYTLDVFDPNWQAANDQELLNQESTFTLPFYSDPWIVAISLGDSGNLDILTGNGSGTNGAPTYPHAAQIVATSNFNYGSSFTRPYLYSKAAWACNAAANDSTHFPPGQSYLELKYSGSIANLNSDWGTGGYYTSFCDAGGFGSGQIASSSLNAGGSGYSVNDTGVIQGPGTGATYKVLTVSGGAVQTYSITAKGSAYAVQSGVPTARTSGGFGTGFKINVLSLSAGTGVIDEDGAHTSWFGSDYNKQIGMNSNLKAKLDEFLHNLAYQAYHAQTSAILTYDTNHLFMCGTYGGVGDAGVRLPVVEGMKDGGCQIFVLNWNAKYPTTALASNQAVYDDTGVPITIWYGITAQADSDMYSYPSYGDPFGDYSTQGDRAQQYSDDMGRILGAQGGSPNDYYVLGINYWALYDNNLEHANYGLLSLRDNAYDGFCAVSTTSIFDQYGFPCGGEAYSYGDYLIPPAGLGHSVTAANQSTLVSFINAF